jgi:two-component system, cell cycle sensor histidine kinase and response regulator CckA
MLKVLFVEDNDDDAYLVRSVFHQLSWDVELIRLYDLKKIHSFLLDEGNAIDMVISDYALPGFTGMDVLLLAKSLYPDLTVLIVSGAVGEERAVELIKAGAVNFLSKGNISRLISIIDRELKEVVQRKEHASMKAELIRSENRFSYLFHFSPDQIVITDGNTLQIDTANKEFSDACGMLSKDLKGRSFLELVGWKEPEKLKEIQKQTQAGTCRDNHELSYTDYEGKERIIIWSVTLFPFDGDDQILWIGKDVTRDRLIQKKVRESEHLGSLGTLAGGIAHDFNNILMVILGYTEMTYEKVKDQPKVLRYQKEVLTAISRARDLIQQILTFSRKREGSAERLFVNPIIKEVLKLLRPTLPANITVRSRIKAELPIMADPTHIHQLIMNLCTNSYHAMRGKGGVLSLETEDVFLNESKIAAYQDSYGEGLDPGNYIKIVVKDTGTGMSPEVKSRVFDPFFTTKEINEGTGLGLSVVHGIVTGYGGGIYIDSVPDEGTTIFIYIPGLDSDSDHPVVDEEVPEIIDEKMCGCIAVVDDEPQIAAIFLSHLEDAGFDVDIYGSGMALLKIVESGTKAYSCVISDYSMPGMDGIELLSRLHKIAPDAGRILCSGSDKKAVLEGDDKQVAHYVLTKPVERKTLLLTVRDTLKMVEGGKA